MTVRNLKPSYCVWELTLACNQRCGHCGSSAGKARPDEMSTAECLDVVDDLAELGTEVITLSGGEPTLRRDWDEIACRIRERGMIPNMVTNGYRLDESLARRMKSAGLANVAVSVDGPEDIHDEIRGAGAFERTTQSLRILREVGMSTTVMTTVNALNLRRLDEVYRVADEVGAARWRCQLAKPMGNMAAGDLAIRPRDLLTLLPKLAELADEDGPSVGIGDSIGFFGPYDSQLRATSWKGTPQRWGGCQAGLRAIGIEANGGIKGCLSMQAFGGGSDPFLEGNVRERSLSDIWFGEQAFAYNRQFDEDDLTGFCRGCRHRRACRGGAKCVAAAVTQCVSEDPYCYYRVASLATRWPGVFGKGQVAAAASVIGMALAGCGGVVLPLDKNDPPPGDQDQICYELTGTAVPWCEPCDDLDCTDAELPADLRDACCVTTDYGVPPEPCETVDCTAEIPEATRAECCAMPEYGVEPDPCENVCCDCDYGEAPPPECCAMPEYGVEPDPCENVCCDCDYGEAPPPECCAMPEYGVEPDPVDCTEVDCSDPALSPEEESCCVGLDYAVEPPPPVEIDCTEVDCADPAIPADAAEQCCSCVDVCCGCDYGDLPPPPPGCCEGEP